ncbi:MAG: hypothetical protein RR998_08965 [Oscillospiraceae bacterium]
MTDNKVQLNIAGISITVNTPEDKEYTAGLAEELDSDIRAILKANEGASVTSAALLCAIDYLNNERKSAKSSSNMRTQIKEYLADAASAKLECDEEHKRNLELSAEIQTLRAQLTRLAIDADNTVTDKMKAQLSAATNELSTLRSKTNELIIQNKSLSDKSAAMSDLISGFEHNSERFKSESELLKTSLAMRDDTIARQARTIDELSLDTRRSKDEIARLTTELDTLESIMLEDEKRNREASAHLASNERAQNVVSPPVETILSHSDDVSYEEISSADSAADLSSEPDGDSVKSEDISSAVETQDDDIAADTVADPMAPLGCDEIVFDGFEDALDCAPSDDNQPAESCERHSLSDPLPDNASEPEPFISEPVPHAFSTEHTGNRPRPFDFDACDEEDPQHDGEFGFDPSDVNDGYDIPIEEGDLLPPLSSDGGDPPLAVDSNCETLSEEGVFEPELSDEANDAFPSASLAESFAGFDADSLSGSEPEPDFESAIEPFDDSTEEEFEGFDIDENALSNNSDAEERTVTLDCRFDSDDDSPANPDLSWTLKI